MRPSGPVTAARRWRAVGMLATVVQTPRRQMSTAQVAPVTQSAGRAQALPTAQGAQLPPQSRSLSSPFLTPSLHELEGGELMSAGALPSDGAGERTQIESTHSKPSKQSFGPRQAFLPGSRGRSQPR